MVLVRDVLLIAFCCALLAFVGSGERPLTRSSEGRVARVAQEMRDSGDWVVPHLNGEVRLEKPPLSSWLVAGVSILACAPAVETWHAYVPPGIAAALLALLAYVWLRRTSPGLSDGSRVAGMMAALVLAAAPGFLLQARSAELDMLLALWVAIALAAFHEFRVHGRRTALLVGYAALGLSILTKGHVGLVVVVPSLLLWGLWERSRQALPCSQKGRWPWHAAGLALLCLIVLPWGIQFLRQSGIRWEDFSKEGLQRFGEKTGHQETWYWYFLQIPGWFMPWFVLLPVALYETADLPPDERSPLRRLCWVWLGWSVLLFSALTAKQRHYAIPFFPPLAILIGDAVARWLEHRDVTRRKHAHVALAAVGVCLMLVALGAPLLAARKDMLAASDARIAWFSAVLAALFFLVGAVVVWKRDRGFSFWWAGCLCLVVVFALTKEKAEGREGPQEFCLQVREQVPAGAVLYDYDVALPRREGAAKNVWRAQVLFYLRRKVTETDTDLADLLRAPEPLYALVTERNLGGVPEDRYDILARDTRFLDHKYDAFLIRGKGGGAARE